MIFIFLIILIFLFLFLIFIKNKEKFVLNTDLINQINTNKKDIDYLKTREKASHTMFGRPILSNKILIDEFSTKLEKITTDNLNHRNVTKSLIGEFSAKLENIIDEIAVVSNANTAVLNTTEDKIANLKLEVLEDQQASMEQIKADTKVAWDWMVAKHGAVLNTTEDKIANLKLAVLNTTEDKIANLKLAVLKDQQASIEQLKAETKVAWDWMVAKHGAVLNTTEDKIANLKLAVLNTTEDKIANLKLAVLKDQQASMEQIKADTKVAWDWMVAKHGANASEYKTTEDKIIKHGAEIDTLTTNLEGYADTTTNNSEDIKNLKEKLEGYASSTNLAYAKFDKYDNYISAVKQTVKFTDEGIECKGNNDNNYKYDYCPENIKNLFPSN